MSLTAMLLIKIVLGLTVMALACVLCMITRKAAAAGRKMAVLVSGYCRKKEYH